LKGKILIHGSGDNVHLQNSMQNDGSIDSSEQTV
jgi:hypothetical protein